MMFLTFLVVLSPLLIPWFKIKERGMSLVSYSMYALWFFILVYSFFCLLFQLYVTFELIRNLRKYMWSYYMEYRVKIWIQNLTSIIYIAV